ncbi:phosphotransferase [Marinovum sp. SP66]|uniref:phosphotransferase n=1 Tax=Marinovum TaxID=367771 RepID=UPI00237A439C|nr:phosphotransferase [Marinovum sp. SP66]MDD9741035.1 phosphotransferase [Marinovum sp. SP66]
MILADLPLRAWAALRPETGPTDVELLGPDVWRVGDVVLKLFPQADLPRFRRIVRAHRQAARIFRRHPGLAAQRLLGFDEACRALLLEFVPGRSGRMALLAGVAPEEILARAAAWLDRLHAAREVSAGRFDARGAVDRLPPAPDCAEPAGYAAALEQLRSLADGLRGRAVRRACLHGDLTLANLLFDEGRVTGIDFENLRRHPADRDIGELWADLLLHVRRLPPELRLMPEPWERVFAAEYPALSPEIARFYTRHRLLRAWAAIPAEAHHRGPGRERQLINIRALMVRGAFA